jgi:hypothetical protein
MDQHLLSHDVDTSFPSAIGTLANANNVFSDTPSCLLSPSVDFHHLNPFFSSLSNDSRHPYAFELEDLKDISFRKPLESRRKPSLFDDEDEEDISIVGTPSTLNSSHPRFGSYSTASTVSSATPSEADSDLIERNKEESSAQSLLDGYLDVDAAKQATQMHALGLGFRLENPLRQVTPLKRVRSDTTVQADAQDMSTVNAGMDLNLRQLQQHVSFNEVSAFNTFDLSDFISDHDQELLSLREEPLVLTHGFLTPDRPRNHCLMASTQSSPLTLQSTGHHRMLSIQRSLSFNGVTPRQDERPPMAMRHSFDEGADLSCNPAYINPCHDQTSFGNEESFSSQMEERAITPPPPPSFYLGGAEHGPMTPNYVNTASSHDIQSLWEESNRESHSASSIDSSPLSSYSPAMIDITLSESMTGSSGVLRSSRSCMTPISRKASPYSTPLVTSSPSSSSSYANTLSVQPINGIITKRSRGRRVPNNPEELNNLGKGGKVYTCKVPGCGKCFKRSEHLKRHVRSIHTDEKPFMCHCGKRFSRHDNLNQHARVHTAQPGAPQIRSPLSFTANAQLSMSSPMMSNDMFADDMDEEEADKSPSLDLAATSGEGGLLQARALYSVLQ